MNRDAPYPANGDLRRRIISALSEQVSEFISLDEFGGYVPHYGELVDIVLAEVRPEMDRLLAANESLLAMLERMETLHVTFLGPDGEELHPEWCRECRVDQVRAELAEVRASLTGVARDLDDLHSQYTVGPSNALRVVGLLLGDISKASGQLRKAAETANEERLASRPTIPADDEAAWRKWISDSIQYGRDTNAHPDSSAEVMWEDLKPHMRVAPVSGSEAPSFGQRCEAQGRIPAGRYYLTIGVEVNDNRTIVNRFDVPGGVNIGGFWSSQKTRIEPAPVAGADTAAAAVAAPTQIVYCGKTEGYTGIDCQLEADHDPQPHEGRFIDPKDENSWLFVQWPVEARREAGGVS